MNILPFLLQMKLKMYIESIQNKVTNQTTTTKLIRKPCKWSTWISISGRIKLYIYK